MQTLAFVFWGIFNVFSVFSGFKIVLEKSETTNVMGTLQAIQWYAVLRLETIFRKVGLGIRNNEENESAKPRAYHTPRQS